MKKKNNPDMITLSSQLLNIVSDYFKCLQLQNKLQLVADQEKCIMCFPAEILLTYRGVHVFKELTYAAW